MRTHGYAITIDEESVSRARALVEVLGGWSDDERARAVSILLVATVLGVAGRSLTLDDVFPILPPVNAVIVDRLRAVMDQAPQGHA